MNIVYLGAIVLGIIVIIWYATRYNELKKRKELQERKELWLKAQQQQKDAQQQQKDALQQQKDALQQERDALQQERDARKREREAADLDLELKRNQETRKLEKEVTDELERFEAENQKLAQSAQTLPLDPTFVDGLSKTVQSNPEAAELMWLEDSEKSEKENEDKKMQVRSDWEDLFKSDPSYEIGQKVAIYCNNSENCQLYQDYVRTYNQHTDFTLFERGFAEEVEKSKSSWLWTYASQYIPSVSWFNIT